MNRSVTVTRLAGGRVTSAARKAEKAKGDLRLAILRARESGETYRDIGDAANLPHPRIVQMVREGASSSCRCRLSSSSSPDFRGMPIGMPEVSMTGTYVRVRPA
jgi:hypothetical protein